MMLQNNFMNGKLKIKLKIIVFNVMFISLIFFAMLSVSAGTHIGIANAHDIIPLAGQNKSVNQSKYITSVIYYNEACSMCADYLKYDLMPSLQATGIKIITKDYVNEKQARAELNELNKKFGIPANMQGHFAIFIDDKIILGGHVPKHVILDILTKDFKKSALGNDSSEENKENAVPEPLLVLQDKMEDAEFYTVWAFSGLHKIKRL